MNIAQLLGRRSDESSAENVRRLLEEISPPQVERRSGPRSNFFFPATVRHDDDNGMIQVPVYIRDISEAGIGLLHSTPFRPGGASVTVQLRTNDAFTVRLSIQWCKRADEHWFISGGRFSHVETP